MSNELKQLESAISQAMKLAKTLSDAKPDRHAQQVAFGLRLEEHMRKRRLTDNMLASKIRDEFNRPISGATVHSWRTGQTTPNPVNMARLSKALRVRPTMLIYGE